AYCWGDNRFGQLGVGDGSAVPRTPLPVAVAGTLSFRAVSAGDSHSCGVTTGNTAYCWGENTGPLGDGTHLSQTAPAPVARRSRRCRSCPELVAQERARLLARQRGAGPPRRGARG